MAAGDAVLGDTRVASTPVGAGDRLAHLLQPASPLGDDGKARLAALEAHVAALTARFAALAAQTSSKGGANPNYASRLAGVA